MSWTTDPELEQMFRDEIGGRTVALAAGAVRLAAQEHDADLTADMYREAHSVKGTARVMGFDALSDAGKLLESTWKAIDQGELAWDPDVAEALLALAETLPDAVEADRVVGTAELRDAIGDLEALLPAAKDPPSPEHASPDAGSERRQPLKSPVPFDVDAIEEATVEPNIGHGPVEELSGLHDRKTGVDEGPSTLDMLRARADKGEASAEAGNTSTGEKTDDDEGSSPVDVIAASDEDAPPLVEAPGSGGRMPRRMDPVKPPGASNDPTDLSSLPLLPVVEGLEVGGLLGAVKDWATEQTISVNAGRLYRMINGVAALRVEVEALLHKAQSHRLATGIDGPDLAPSIAAITNEVASIERQSIELTAVPVGGMLSTVPQLVGFMARKLGKEVRFEVTGGDVVVDRSVLDLIGDPIRQLVVNSVRHGIETPEQRIAAGKPTTGLVAVDLDMVAGQIQITVSDDGAGVDWETIGRQATVEGRITSPTTDPEVLMPLLFAPGFSTVVETELGGSGNGLAAVAEATESLLGRMTFQSELGNGTVVRLTVPTSRALQRIAILEDGGLRWGLPDSAIDQIIPLSQADIDWEQTPPHLRLRDQSVPLYAISQVVGGGTASLSEVLVVSHRAGTAAFAAGTVETVREVATKELGPLLQGPRHITGAALLGGGDVVLVLDPFELVERARQGESSASLNGPRLLIVDDSPGVRAVVAAALTSSGFVPSSVKTAAEAMDHLAARPVHAIVVDYSMPGEDGVTLVRRIRKEMADVPIVMLSGVADDEDQRRALEAGADAFLDKSDLREGALAATLHHLVNRQRLRAEASEILDR